MSILFLILAHVTAEHTQMTSMLEASFNLSLEHASGCLSMAAYFPKFPKFVLHYLSLQSASACIMGACTNFPRVYIQT